MSRHQKAVMLVPFVLLVSQAYAQRNLRSVDGLNNIIAEDNSHHDFEGEEAERLKRRAPHLDDIKIKVDAVDSSHHGAGGRAEGEEAERLKRQANPLNAINIGVNAVDISRHGHGAGRGPSGAGGHAGGRPRGDESSPEVPEAEAAERLKPQAPRLAGINVNVNATDNSKHGGSGRGHNGGKGGRGGPPHPGPVGPAHPQPADPAHPEPTGPSHPDPHGAPHADEGAGDEGPAAPGHHDDNAGGDHGGQSQTQSQSQSGAGSPEQSQSQAQRRHRRQAPRLDDINVNVNVVDNSKHSGSGRGRNGGKGGRGGPSRPDPVGPAHPVPTGPSDPEPSGPAQPEPAGHALIERCADGWTYVNKTRKCFKVVIAFSKEGHEILWDKCEKIGGKVASIHNAEENAALTAFANGSIPQEFRGEIQWFVFGLHSPDGGLNWQWKDGSPLNYVNWASNEPQTRRDNKEKCAVVVFDGGPAHSRWTTVHCTAVSEWSATGTLCMRSPYL